MTGISEFVLLARERKRERERERARERERERHTQREKDLDQGKKTNIIGINLQWDI